MGPRRRSPFRLIIRVSFGWRERQTDRQGDPTPDDLADLYINDFDFLTKWQVFWAGQGNFSLFPGPTSGSTSLPRSPKSTRYSQIVIVETKCRHMFFDENYSEKT